MKELRVIYRRDPGYIECPSCNTTNTLYRSHSRGFWESALKNLTFYKIYRCKNCGWRGYLSSFIVTTKSIRNFLFFILLALIAAFIVLQILRRFIY